MASQSSNKYNSHPNHQQSHSNSHKNQDWRSRNKHHNNRHHHNNNAKPYYPKSSLRQSPQIIISDSDISTKCAYATMVINNVEYLSGALTLAWSLMTCGSKANRVIIIDSDINEQYGNLIKQTGLFTDILVIPHKFKYRAIQKRWRRYEESGIYDWIDTAFNKYYCFTLTQYQRVIMMDADQICLKNPDELFKLSCPAGICSLYSEKNDFLQNSKHGHKVSNSDVRKSYERNWGIRGSLFMIEPSSNTFNDIKQRLDYQQNEYGGIGDTKCFLGADEKFLTKYFMTNHGDSHDSHWTHIHSKFSRLSYIDKTTLSDDPYFLHFCTFKPWKNPGSDKWIHEQWEDIVIWVFAATSTLIHIKKKNADFPLDIIRPDAQFFADVLGQEWAKKYLQSYPNIKSEDVLMNSYHLMARSYQEMQCKKQNQSNDLKVKMKENKQQKLHSFDYSQYKLLPALMSEQKEVIPDKVIWQFWDSDENIPVNIQFCIDSVKLNNSNWKHILITPQNIWNYLDETEMPKDLLLYEKACHISDVVRVAVLAKYGGIYCDASIVCFADCEYMNFDYIWDELLMKNAYDFVGFRYDNERYSKWKNDEAFCCWFMATKKENGLMYSWLNKIKLLMKGKKSSSELKMFDLIFDEKVVAFKKYVALGPVILDELFDEYVHYHRNFKFKLYDPRDFALLDHLFDYQQLWYLNEKKVFDFDAFFKKKKQHFIKLFCAHKGSVALVKMLKQKHGYSKDEEVTLENVLDSGLIISDIFRHVRQ